MKKRIFTAIAIAAIAFTACSDDQNVDTTTNENSKEVQFSSSFGVTQSKVTGNNWDATDAIGVSMVDFGTTTPSIAGGVTTENIEYTTSGTGASESFTSIAPITFGSGTYDFIAYYPFLSGQTLATPYTIDVSNQTDLAAIDFMYAFQDNGALGFTSAFTGTVDLPFVHQLARVIIKVKLDPTVPTADIAGMTVSISDLITDATYDLTNTAVATAGAGLTAGTTVATQFVLEPTTSIAVPTGYESVYEAIVIPQESAAHIINFNLPASSEDLSFEIPTGYDFAAGKQYTFDMTLSRTELSLTGTITPWDDSVNEIPGTAN